MFATTDLSAQLALKLATLPNYRIPSSTPLKRRRSPKSDFALLHKLGVCADCGLKCPACKKDKRARRAAVQDFDVLAMNLNAMLASAKA